MAGKVFDVRILRNDLMSGIPARMVRARDQIVREVAKAVESDWKAHAPVLSGAYQESIHIENGRGPGELIVTTDVPGDDPYDIFNEYGTEAQAPNPVARKAAERQRKTMRGKAAAKIRQAAST
jgi:HK97 gp10 family phage protein